MAHIFRGNLHPGASPQTSRPKPKAASPPPDTRAQPPPASDPSEPRQAKHQGRVKQGLYSTVPRNDGAHSMSGPRDMNTYSSPCKSPVPVPPSRTCFRGHIPPFLIAQKRIPVPSRGRACHVSSLDQAAGQTHLQILSRAQPIPEPGQGR
ncbi:hypothetical protein GQ53DRAFT_269545 [Thozetella sp. PMI_491]|nr:hypothetical protein GQ53DRAFT_269545 [Thozetella sp. PMI_491]